MNIKIRKMAQLATDEDLDDWYREGAEACGRKELNLPGDDEDE